MEETIIKCDWCNKKLNNKDDYIEIRFKNKQMLIDEKHHFCDTSCLMKYIC